MKPLLRKKTQLQSYWAVGTMEQLGRFQQVMSDKGSLLDLKQHGLQRKHQASRHHRYAHALHRGEGSGMGTWLLGIFFFLIYLF